MKIAVLVSGGVDSSVALALLKQQGHDVTAFYLKIWLEDELSFLGECPWEDDLAYVKKVCAQFNVPLEIIPLQKEYWDLVVQYTIKEVKAGRTPNPDMLCNKRIKFGMFYTKIDPSFEKVATGHYARIKELPDGKVQLLRAPDLIKDQTYFLAYLTQKQLQRAMFPIGNFVKNEVRELARQFDLPNKERKESQGICFLGKLKFNEFIKHYLGEKPGNIIEYETGKILGQHKGFWFHTIGQRQGSGLSGGPWYVVDKDIKNNIVYMSRTYHDHHKKRDTFIITDCNWIAQHPPLKKDLQVKVRHGKKIYKCILESLEEDRFKVKLAEHDQGIAPGQFAVLYDGEVCLGAGIITDEKV